MKKTHKPSGECIFGAYIGFATEGILSTNLSFNDGARSSHDVEEEVVDFWPKNQLPTLL